MRKRFIALMMLPVLLFSIFSGCGKTENSNSDDSSVESIEQKETEHILYKNGRSDYKIVIPKTANDDEKMAASELIYFFEDATGYKFEMLTDEGLTHNSDNRYISLGQTSLLNTSGLQIDYSQYKNGGFNIATVDGSVYIVGSKIQNCNGTTHGVYEFLEREIGLEIFSNDEFVYDFDPVVKLLDFDLFENPDYSIRSLGYGVLGEDATFNTRMRLDLRGDASWVIWGHSHFTILDPEVYAADHPEWYSPDGEQLCLSNMEMRAQFIENVKKRIENVPNANWIAITQPDNTGFCTCSNCVENIQKYGTAGGLNVVFMNQIADEVDAWLAENYPERQMNYRTFGYHATEGAPVKKDENGNYVPVCEEVIARDNVMVELCMPGLDFTAGLTAPSNASYYEKVKGWNAVCNNLSVYSYCINFWYYFYPFNNFGSIENLYRECYENGATSIHENGPIEEKVTGMQEMRIYIQSKLMWDTSLHYDDLVSQFMNGYYKEAGEAMYKYYNLWRTHYEVLRNTQGVTAGIYFPLDKASYWPKGLMVQFENILDEAYAAIDGLKDSDPAQYQKLFERIRKEQLSIDFICLELHSAYYTKSELAAMIEDFKYYANKFDLRNYKEGQSLDAVYERWETKIA